jgi:hypothetical protein
MKTTLKICIALVLVACATAAQAAPRLTGLPLARREALAVPSLKGVVPVAAERPVLSLKTAEPPAGACPGSAVHCVISTWTASSDGAANPTLAYNFYLWPVGGTAPVCTATGPCTGAAPVNAAPVAAGCSAACGFTDTAVVPGKFNAAVTAILNGVESFLSNVIFVTIAPAAPVLSGSGQ